MGLIAVAMLLRFIGKDLIYPDYTEFLRPWSAHIASHGYFAALGEKFANYNVPYLYLLTILSWLHTHTSIPLLYLVKGLSVVFDVVLALFVVRIVRLRYPDLRVAALAGVLTLMLPTVVLNGAYWAQCDTIYSAFTMAGLYYLLRDRPWPAAILFGVAISFKLQAIFVLPVLFVMLLAGRVRIRHLLAIPAVYIALAVPAWALGRPLRQLLLIYVDQGGQYQQLTLGAPTLYAFIRPNAELLPTVRTAGIAFALAGVLALAYIALRHRTATDPAWIVLTAAASSLLVPFLLPGMHERYFMQADVLTVVAALWLPSLWAVPLLTQVASFMSYLPYMFRYRGVPPMDLRLLSLAMFAALALLIRQLLRDVPATAEPPAAEAPPAAEEQPAAEKTDATGKTMSFLAPSGVGNTIAG